MKTANLLWTSLLVFSSAAAYSQAAANSALQSSASAGQTAVSGSSATAAASATPGHVTSAASSSAAPAQTASASTAATQSTNVAAELTRKVDSKNAKVGDEVTARTTSKAQLADGTALPKGTRLLGKVTESEAKSGARHDGHLAFAFDRAVLHDGRELPIHATLQSISAPVDASAIASGSDDFAASAAPVAISGGASGSARGGLLGGGAAVPHTGLVSGATSTIAQSPARVTETAASTTHTVGAAAGQTLDRSAALAGESAATVNNLPGVTASGSASGSTALDAKDSNVGLSSGTQMTFAISAR